MSDVARDLAELLVETRDDPRAFIELVLRASLRRWQAEVSEEIRLKLAGGERHLEILVRSCHGAGKTFYSAGLALWYTSTRPGSRGLTTAPSWQAVEGLLWVEIEKLYRQSLLAAVGVGRLLSTSIEFAPAWDLVGLSSDHPQNLEGRHGSSAVRVVDEAKAVDEGIFESTEGLLDAEETADIWISTPSIAAGAFFDRDIKGGPRVLRRVITIDDLIAEGLPGKAAWKQRRLEAWGENSPAYQTRALARYASDAEGALFPFAWVERAIEASFVVVGAPVAGLDVAGSVAGDETALALVSGPDSAGRYQVHVTHGWQVRDTQESKGRALLLVRDANARVLRVDVIGLGQGVADSIAQDFERVERFRASDRPTDAERFTNKKAEVAWFVRDLLEKGLLRLPADVTLRSQLVAMRYEVNAQGRIRVVDPHDSPDRLDAVLIALSGFSTQYPDLVANPPMVIRSETADWMAV